LAARYQAALPKTVLRVPHAPSGSISVWHQFTIRSSRRDELREYLAGRGIMCGVLYPTPVHLQPAYAQAGVSLPETERACREVLCLPIHPAITVEDVDRVCAEIIRWSST
jgi:dTDP-4-amino-4,6-dideoxygalactose transaminase